MKWLAFNNLEFQLIDIVSNVPDKDILKNALIQLGDRKKLFNTNGLSYRNLGGAKVVQAMTDDQVIDVLASDGKLIKRPFLITGEGNILAGFKQDVWEDILLSRES